MKKYRLLPAIVSTLFLFSCSDQKFPFKNNEAFLYFQKAQEHEKNGESDLALECFNKADSLSPDTPVILHERGLLKTNLELYNEGIDDITRSIDLTTSDPVQKLVYLENRGLVYLDMGEKDKACADFHAVGSGNSKGYIEKYCK